MPEETTSLRETWDVLKKSHASYYLTLFSITLLVGVISYRLGIIDYGTYVSFLALAVALAVVALTELRFYLQGLKLESIEQKLEALRKFEEEHHPK